MNELIKIIEHYNIVYDSKIICPFHGDVNPSMSLDNENNFWFCFGCQEGGDAYKFHKKMQNLKGITNEIAILTTYNQIINKRINKEQSEKLQKFHYEKKGKSYFRQCLKEAKDYYYGLKNVDWKSKEMDNVEILAYMNYRGFKSNLLNRYGAKYTYKDETYPIVFPIKDNGRFKGWVSRTCDIEIQKTRKYLYNKGFRRVNTLAGDYKNSEYVLLVEGFFDMLKAKQLGIKKVAAILGWKISDKQITKLKSQGVKYVISALDNDKAGKQGTKYLENFFTVYKFPYPQDIKDMGDMDRIKFKKIKNKMEELKWVL